MGYQVGKSDGICFKCGKAYKKGDRIWFHIEAKGPEHADCHGPEPKPEPPKRKGPIPSTERCTERRILFGETMRCAREAMHGGGHSYEFTVAMGRRFWAKLATMPADANLNKVLEEIDEDARNG